MNNNRRQLDITILRTIRREAGQSLVMFTLMLSVLALCVGLIVDVGSAVQADQRAQGASDAAALAASAVIRDGGTVEVATAEALEVAAANGFTDGEDGVTVDVNIPPESGPFAGDPQHAEVIIDGHATTYFFSLAQIDIVNIQGRAVANSENVPGNYGIIALNPTDCHAFEINGTAGITIDGGGVFVNSNCPTAALYADGTVSIEDAVNKVVGGWEIDPNATVDPLPTPARPITDPLGDVPVPTPPDNVRPCPNFSGPAGTRTLQPGRYECTIDPSGPWSVVFEPGDYHITGGVIADGGGSITFNDGVYTLGGVGIRVSGAGSITVNNAMLYIEEGEVKLTGNGVTTIHAPEDGTYAGIAIFQARDLATQLDMNGTSLQGGSGTVYAAGAKISLVGTSASSNLQFISDTFIMSGTPDLDLTFDSDFIVDHPNLKLVE